MIYLLLSFGFFLSAVFFHLMWCRARRHAELQVKPLIGIAFFFLLGYVLAVKFFFKAMFAAGFNSGIWFLPLFLTSVLFYALGTGLYVCFYYATVIDSPSSTVLVMIKKYKGLSYEELRKFVTNEKFIVSR